MNLTPDIHRLEERRSTENLDRSPSAEGEMLNSDRRENPTSPTPSRELRFPFGRASITPFTR